MSSTSTKPTIFEWTTLHHRRGLLDDRRSKCTSVATNKFDAPSLSHQSTLMIASTPSPCDSDVIYNQIFNLLPRRPNLVSVYLKHNALHKIRDTYRVFIHIEHLTWPARGTSTAILWIDYDMGGSKSNKLSLVGYVTWLLYIYFGITKHTTMQKKRVCLSWHVRITL